MKLNKVEPSLNFEQFEQIQKQLKIGAMFWDRDSHGLFDYDARNLSDSHLMLTGCSMICSDIDL